MNSFLHKPKVESVISQLARNYKPEFILIFGSYSKGNVHQDSDLDLIIVKDTDKRSIWRRVEARKSFETDLPVDIIVYNPKEFAELQKTSLFLKKVLKEGKIVFNRNKSLI